MTAHHSNRALEVFDAVRALPIHSREDRLRELCRDDWALLQDVRSLLDYDGRPTGFLDQPVARLDEALAASGHAFEVDSIAQLQSPETIGPYAIVRTLGEGGMGIVYLAQQNEPVHRAVALKVIKPGLDTRAVIARFQSERQALAIMDHPNVARVFDAGSTADGRPWFAMELVNGNPITEWADGHRLDTHARLELFCCVCHAVQHAHQKGVIHRDLKPSNILVQDIDGRPMPKVIDFGIARATDQRQMEHTRFTGRGDFIGTPQYMSPEQLTGDGSGIDTRSDIYALGVVLYELLVGEPPIDPQSLHSTDRTELPRLIRDTEPFRPSTRVLKMDESTAQRNASARQTDAKDLAKRLRGDLDWIVMCAMAKERDRRYASASEFAADIQRHLLHEPVQAGPPGAAYRARKFVRRNRALVVGSTAFAAALVAGVMGTGWQAILADRARADAQQQAEIARAVNSFLNADLLAAADPRNPNRELTMRAALDAAAARIETRFADQPRVEAAIRSTLGIAYRNLGLYELAQPHLQRAHELAVHEFGEESDQAISALVDLAWYEYQRGRADLAEPLFARSLKVAHQRHGAQSEPVLQAMANLGMTQTSLGKFDEANDRMSAALEVRLRTVGPDHLQTIYLRNNMGSMFVRQRRFDQALPMVTAALESLRRTRPANHPDFAHTLIELGICHEQMGRIDLAEPLFEEAMAVARVALGEEHQDYAAAVGAVARVRLMQRKPEEAAPLFAEALAIFRLTRGERDPEVLTLMHNLATTYVTLDRLAEAQPMFDEALAGRRAVLGEKHADTLASMYGMARLHGKRGEHHQADELFASAISSARTSLSPRDPFLGIFLTGHGLCLTELHRYDDAERALIESHEILAAAFGPAHTRTLQAIDGLIALYVAWQRPEQAEHWEAIKSAAPSAATSPSSR